jgi:hypothetical protein
MRLKDRPPKPVTQTYWIAIEWAGMWSAVAVIPAYFGAARMMASLRTQAARLLAR